MITLKTLIKKRLDICAISNRVAQDMCETNLGFRAHLRWAAGNRHAYECCQGGNLASKIVNSEGEFFDILNLIATVQF